jgi:FMN phosphatase YigB (HAD superfamily)
MARSALLSPAAVDAVVFDFDGTLVATRSADQATVAALIATDPSAATGAEVFWEHEGEPIDTRVELAWPGRGDEVLPLFERQVGPRPCPGVSRLLERLSQTGLPLAVVSSRRRAALEAGLGAAGLRHHFGVIVGLEDVREPKPSPEGLLRALGKLGVQAGRAVDHGQPPQPPGRPGRALRWRRPRTQRHHALAPCRRAIPDRFPGRSGARSRRWISPNVDG